ncbi:hypothetical protein O0L34_g1139 [Tuta absoluta]|nr:hypothetical protein O0L34_g1139 [Tuta absoluta]
MVMGRHREWRRIAKRERRRRIRTQEAKKRDGALAYNLTEHKDQIKEEEELELFKLEQIERSNLIENQKWLRAERVAMEQWRKLQEHKEKLRMQHLEEETKRRLEFELEQENKRKAEERLKQIEEENKRRQEVFMKHLEEFLSGDNTIPPDELLVSRETKPDCDHCPFFFKTACCRFGDQCSRNHRYPGISKVLLATNFYSHFGLENADEHDADIMLEYEDSDTYREFKEFFYDILPEFEKFGRITQLKICNNYEKHLRGNTYVEFAELRCAVAAYRALHTRWYGGKQLSLQFCLISSWKNAICGLQSRKRCPKGRSCNFLHVFRNPNNLFNSIRDNQEYPERSRRTPPRSWRWSESPEVEVSRWRRSRSAERRDRRIERDSREESRRERRDRHERSERSRRRRSCDRDSQREEKLKDLRHNSEDRHERSSRHEDRHRDKGKRNSRDESRNERKDRSIDDERGTDSPQCKRKRSPESVSDNITS